MALTLTPEEWTDLLAVTDDLSPEFRERLRFLLRRAYLIGAIGECVRQRARIVADTGRKAAELTRLRRESEYGA